MSIQENVQKAFENISVAEKSPEEKHKRNLLKLIIAEFQRRPNLNKELTDDEAIKIINKFIKNNVELSKYQFENTENIMKENEYLRTFLPHEVTENEIRSILEGLKVEPNVGHMIGQVMGKIKAMGAIANGQFVKDIVEKYMQESKSL